MARQPRDTRAEYQRRKARAIAAGEPGYGARRRRLEAEKAERLANDELARQADEAAKLQRKRLLDGGRVLRSKSSREIHAWIRRMAKAGKRFTFRVETTDGREAEWYAHGGRLAANALAELDQGPDVATWVEIWIGDHGKSGDDMSDVSVWADIATFQLSEYR